MGRVQTNVVLFCLGLFLLSVVVFRHEWFYSNDALPYLLIALLFAGFVLISVGLFRLLTGKAWHGVLVLLTIEAFLIGTFNAISISQTNKVSGKLKEYLTQVYVSGFMNCIQYDRAISRFDGQLQYTLAPGKHKFENLEFSNTEQVNHVGLRDSEQNLRAPEVIFLGDSYTMGWGVEERDSFVRQFAVATGKKCLNAGISSYGTAREYLLLKRLPLDSCKALVIQYHENDLLENYMFFHNGERLAPEKEFFDGYHKSLRINFLVKHYYPFKYLYWILRNSGLNLKPIEEPKPTQEGKSENKAFPTEHGPYLTKVLKAVRAYYRGPIVLFCMGKPIFPEINGQLARVIDENKDLNIQWLDMQKAGFEGSDFFVLDMHLNQQGHEKVASQLAELMTNDWFLAQNKK